MVDIDILALITAVGIIVTAILNSKKSAGETAEKISAATKNIVELMQNTIDGLQEDHQEACEAIAQLLIGIRSMEIQMLGQGIDPVYKVPSWIHRKYSDGDVGKHRDD